MCVVNATPRPLYPRERPDTHCTGGWVGLRAGLDRWGKSRPPQRLDPRTVQPVATLSRPNLSDNIIKWTSFPAISISFPCVLPLSSPFLMSHTFSRKIGSESVESSFIDSNLWPAIQHSRELMWFYIPVMYFQDVRQATVVLAPKLIWTTAVGSWTHKTQSTRAVMVRHATKVLAPKPTWTTTVGSWTHKTQSTKAVGDESRWQHLQQHAWIYSHTLYSCLLIEIKLCYKPIHQLATIC
jgi:hypothetical protein